MGFGRSLRWAALPALLLFAACASDGGEPPPPPPPPPPVDPPGNWPIVECGSGTVGTILLDQIQDAADDARLADALDEDTYWKITTLVTRCRWNFLPCPLPNWVHCTLVRNARDAAYLGDWALCIKELEHGH